MCFAPQLRAFLRHSNFLKVFRDHRFLEMCFAGQKYTFSTSQLPKAVRCWCALCVFTSTCASRHTGVQLFISNLTSWPRTCRRCRAKNQAKTQYFAILLPFHAFHLFSSDSFSSLIFFFFSSFFFHFMFFSSSFSFLISPFAVHLTILLEIWFLDFLRWIQIPGLTYIYTLHQ